MKINGSSGIGGSSPVSNTGGTTRASTPSTTSQTTSSSSSSVSSSDGTDSINALENKFAESDFNAGKVQNIQASISQGNYTINSGAIADGLIKNIVSAAA